MSDIFDYESGKTEGMSENQVITILKSMFTFFILVDATRYRTLDRSLYYWAYGIANAVNGSETCFDSDIRRGTQS